MIEQPVATSVYQEAGISIPVITNKRWGEERLFINGEGTSTRHQTGYCMKELIINADARGSLHYHIHKHECLYLLEGDLCIEWANGQGSPGMTYLSPGEVFVIPPGFQHRLCAGPSQVRILEASTIDDPNDSIRVSM